MAIGDSHAKERKCFLPVKQAIISHNHLCTPRPTIPNISFDDAKVRNYLQVCK